VNAVRTDAPPDDALRAQLAHMARQLDEIAAETRRSRERWEVLDELVHDATPVLRQAMGSATDRLDALSRRGYGDFVAGGIGVVDRIVGAFDREDVEALGDNVVLMLETLREMTQPEVLRLLRRTVDDLHDEPTAGSAPPSLLSLLNRLRRPESRRGLDRLLRLLESVGAAVPPNGTTPKEGSA